MKAGDGMKWQMPIGVDNFFDIRSKHYYFVDKTDFIRQLIDGHSAVTLITRPRRFGKTLTLSMLEYFFSIEKESQSRHLFDGLAIEGAGAAYMAQRGQYPVLFLSLKDFSCRSWPDMLDMWAEYLQALFLQHTQLREGNRVQPELIEKFQDIVTKKATKAGLANALALLLLMMRQYYGKKVIVLMDEYDAPIQQSWEGGFYEDCIAFMKQFLGSVLKSNDNLDFAVLTGVLRVAKESIFSGLNNFDVYSVLRSRYSEVFGFTPQEVQSLLAALQLQDHLQELKFWYDGYRIGESEIYNPWSVINYVANDCYPRPYWVRTSGNGILRFLLSHADALRIKQVYALLEGQGVRVTLDESVIYPEIGQNQGALFTLLLTTGYLTVDRALSLSDDRYALQIPNAEIRKLYSTEILNTLARDVNKNTFDDLFDYLLDGDAENFELQLQQILKAVVSVYDAANKESFYHGFILGMTALFLGKDYTVESNRESGYGRFDLAIIPKDVSKAGVIMEFKVAASEADMAAKAKEALQQIEEREYVTEFRQRGIQRVWKYGIAFCGKKILAFQGPMC